MEVVELVEVSGQTHQGMENFEDLILTVVPEGQEEAALAAAGSAGEGQRTIVVTEVRGPHGMEEQNAKIESLEARVEQLEDQVHFLEDELRLIRRKVIHGNPSNNYSTIRRTVLEVLSKQSMKISVSDFEDEIDTPEPVGRARQSQGQKRSKYENGFSDEEDEEESEIEEEPPVRSTRRRGPGRPPKSQSFGRKPKTHRVELTPPPPKCSRPRGRPRRTVEVTDEIEEDAAATTTVEDKSELEKPSEVDLEQEFAEENTTVEMDAVEDEEEHEVEEKVEEVDEESVETSTTGTILTTKEQVTVTPTAPEEEGPKGTSPKKGRRRGAAEALDHDPTPVRASTRARKISRKASD